LSGAANRGVLCIVATPIGNLEDITLRAIRVLSEADAILAEDTRHTRGLCAHHGIKTRLIALHAHTPAPRIEELAAEIAAGARYALVTDAGTPLVSDPGAELVDLCAQRGVKIEPIPGPSAAIAAISACGLRISSFRFVGFLPRSGARRRDAIAQIARASEATVLFEAPQRTAATLRDIAGTIGDARRAALCRELTKLHEEIVRGTPAELADHAAQNPPRGEVTLVIEGAQGEGEAREVADPAELARELVAAGVRTKDAARLLAERLSIPTRDAYAAILAVSGDDEAGDDEADDEI
jgi:16S rRNA (cytidine1402-2'-O)-methyltransferase